MKRILILVLVVFGLPLFADRKMKPISQSELKDSWAFTVKQGTLLCDKSSMAVAFMDETGKTYWLNGTAKGVYNGSLDVTPIWLDNYMGKTKIGKKDMGVFIKMGQELCSK